MRNKDNELVLVGIGNADTRYRKPSQNELEAYEAKLNAEDKKTFSLDPKAIEKALADKRRLDEMTN